MAAKAFYNRRELTLRLPEVRRFWLDVTSGRFDAAEQIHTNRTDWEYRSHLLGLARHVPADSAAVDDWLNHRPGAALPLIAKGYQVVGMGWRARTNDRPDPSSRRQIEDSRRFLRQAEDIFAGAARTDPDSPVPWAGLLETGLGLHISQQEFDYRLEQMAGRFPLYSGFITYLQYMSDRWYGSHEQMFDFADSVNDAAADGSPLHALQAEAAIERFVLRNDLLRPKRALVAEGRLEPLLRAAERSVLHPSFEPDAPAGVHALSCFVMAFERYGCRRLNHHLVPLLRRHWMADHPSDHFRGAFSPTVMWRGLSARYRLASMLPVRRGRPSIVTGM